MGGYEEDESGGTDYTEIKEARTAEPVYAVRKDYEKRIESRAVKNDNVTRIYPETRYEIMLTHPKTVDETSAVINNIRAGNVCIINLDGVEKDKSQRIADVLGGAAYSLGCGVERISNGIFIIAPNGVTISGKLKNEIKSESSIFPWVASR